MDTWFRHQLIFKDTSLGDVVSMSPDKSVEKPHISPKLTILDFIKIAENDHIPLSECQTFYFSVVAKYDTKHKIAELVTYLRQNSSKAALLYLSRSEECLGLLLPAHQHIVDQIPNAVDAFVCHIYTKAMQDEFGEVICASPGVILGNGGIVGIKSTETSAVSAGKAVLNKRPLPSSPPLSAPMSGNNAATDGGEGSPDSDGQPVRANKKRVRINEEVNETQEVPARVLADSDSVKDHYNLLSRKESERIESQIYHLRCLNNWVKQTMIGNAITLTKRRAPSDATGMDVLDLACGMGGDLLKWFSPNHNMHKIASYVGVDIASNSLQHFLSERVPVLKKDALPAVGKLVCADLCTDDLAASTLPTYRWGQKGTQATMEVPLAHSSVFDIISAQFSIHYMFRSEETANNLFRQISRHLKPRGVFIATTIDSRVLGSHLQNRIFSQPYNRDISVSDTLVGQQVIEFRNEFADLVLKITFEANSGWERLVGSSGHVPSLASSVSPATSSSASTSNSGYGIRYTFSLLDKPDEAAVNAPEYVVPLGSSLEQLARAHGLRVRVCENFQSYLHEQMSNAPARSSLIGKGVLNANGEISQSDWDIARMYVCLVFEKIGAEEKDDLKLGSTTHQFSLHNIPDGPPPDYMPPSPDGPPPDYMPPSPDGPPPDYMPPSPDGPPPDYMPPSPDGSPPDYMPPSPDGPPPDYMPPSPDGPPPDYMPPSPDGPPPDYMPPSPDGPPPDYMPPSPDGPPPGYMPPSPDGPPPDYEDANEGSSAEPDESLKRILAIRAIAISFVDDEDMWDELDDDQRDEYMEKAAVVYEELNLH